MNKTKILDKFLEYHLSNQKTQFKKDSLENYEVLIELKVIYPISEVSDLTELNSDSQELNKVAIAYAEKKNKSKIPKDLIKGFGFIEDFRDKIKIENGIRKNVINAYSELIKGMKSFFLLTLKNNGFDVKSFYINELDKKGERDNALFLFEDILFRFLPYSGYSPREVWEICKFTLDSDDKYYVLEFGADLPNKNIELSQELQTLIKEEEEIDSLNFQVNLLRGLHHNGDKNAYNKLLELVEKNKDLGFGRITSLKNLTKLQLKNLYENFIVSETSSASKVKALCDIIENKSIDNKFRNKCFKEIEKLLKESSDEDIHNVFSVITYDLIEFESKKYEFLILYLGKTSNYNVLRHFFWRFKDPQYLFHLILSVYSTKWGRNSIKFFEQSISHFWTTSRDETEKHILDMFNPKYKLGLLPVEIMMCGYRNPLQVNLLSLGTQEEQIKAIDAICMFPHSFDKLLPLILELRNSKFKSVRDELESQLGHLIIESYHKMLYDSIINLLTDSTSDERFAERLKKPLELYNRVKDLKKSVNDLNPEMNEKDLMNFYYELEYENRLKIMEEINTGENSFLKMAKNITVVRGNSWKIGGKEIQPLSNFKSEQWINGKAFKNPELFEFTLNNYDKA